MLALIAWPAAVAAQEPRLFLGPPHTDSRYAARPAWQTPAPETGSLVVAGVLGAVAGFAAGATIGYKLERRYWPCSCDDPGLLGLIVGGAVGPILTVPTAVHIANGGRGPFGRALGASALAGGIGFLGLLGGADSEAGLLFLFGAPIAEIALSVRIERSAAAR
jgi:hypothetical protein